MLEIRRVPVHRLPRFRYDPSMLERGDTYDDTRARFRWGVPARFNIGVDICDKWAGEADRLAYL